MTARFSHLPLYFLDFQTIIIIQANTGALPFGAAVLKERIPWKRKNSISQRPSTIPRTSSTSATPTVRWPRTRWPGITDFEAIFHQVRNQCDLIWLENLNLRGGFKKDILDYIRKKHPDLVPLYDAIYNKRDRSYFRGLEDQAERLAKENSCPFVDNELPYGRAEPGHPVIVDYFYHEEVRGSENTGKRTQKV